MQKYAFYLKNAKKKCFLSFFFEANLLLWKTFRIFDVRNDRIYFLQGPRIMANKRSLKRSITLICEELLVECVASSLYGPNRDNAEALIFSIVKMQDDFLRRISHPEPGMPVTQYFKDLREKFAAQTGEIIDQINNL